MGKLYIELCEEKGRTRIKDSYFTAPFKVTSPFYRGNMAELMIMQASAGILEGDDHRMEFLARSGSRARITGQSYTKIFAMDGGTARQHLKLTVEPGASLEYLPCPVIPFARSKFQSESEIHVAPGARLALWEIFSCGRVGMGERFQFQKYRSATRVYEEKKLVFADRTSYVPGEGRLDCIGYLENYTHAGLLYLYGYETVGLIDSQGLETGLTRAKRGQLLRVLAHSGEEIIQYLNRYL